MLEVNITAKAACDNDGSATAIVTGAVEPVSYVWSPIPASTQTINNLPAGTYRVDVQDSDGFTAFDTVTIVDGLTNFLFHANRCLMELGNDYLVERSYGRQKTCKEKFQLLKHWIEILKCLPTCTEEVQAFKDVVFEGDTSLILFGFDLFGHPNYYMNNTPNTPLQDIVDEINAIPNPVVTATLVNENTIRITYISGGASNNGKVLIVSRDMSGFILYFAGGDTTQVACPTLPCDEDFKCTLIKKIRTMCPQCN